MSGKYDDIIHLPHHVSQTHPQMPMCDRAAQFSPFAALTDYGVVIRETGRLKETRPELDEDAKSELDSVLRCCLLCWKAGRWWQRPISNRMLKKKVALAWWLQGLSERLTNTTVCW